MSTDPSRRHTEEEEEEQPEVHETGEASSSGRGMPWGARLKMAEMEQAERRANDGDGAPGDEGPDSSSEDILHWIGEPSNWGPYPDLRMRAVLLLEDCEPAMAMEGLAGIILDEEADEELRIEARDRLEDLCHEDGLEDLEGEIEYAEALAWKPPKPIAIQSNQGKASAILIAAVVHAIVVVALTLYTLRETQEELLPLTAISTSEEEEAVPLDPEFTASKVRPVPSAGMSKRIISTHTAVPFALPSARVDRSSLPGIGDADMTGFGTDFGRGGGLKLHGGSAVPKLAGIQARKLAVVLDVSGSMSQYLPSLAKEIGRRFPSAEILLSPNSMMYRDEKDSPVAVFFSASDNFYGLSRFKDRLIQKGDVGTAILHVLRKTECDAIYVLTDFQDGESDPDPYEDIVTLARKKRVKLHFGIPHSVNSISNYSSRRHRLKILIDYAKMSGSIRTKLD